jgi:CheY-like chemotaxis protein
MRFYLRSVLGRAGHEVREAADGDEGLRADERRPADLVLCDLFKPEKDGLETIREARRRWPGVKLVARRAGAFDGRLDALPVARALGPAAAIAKPFSRQDGLALVGGLLAPAAAARGPHPSPPGA